MQKVKKKKKIYVPVKAKFIIAVLFSALWVVISVFLSLEWIAELAGITNIYVAVFIISGVAYIPGFLNAFLLISVVIDRQPEFKMADPHDYVTILIAAYNEEKGIYETLSYIKKQDYSGRIRTIVINNNSSDNTRGEVLRASEELGIEIECIDEKIPGKFNALNTGLKSVKSEYFITLDADTILNCEAVRNLMSRVKSAPRDVGAVAGSVLVRNTRDNILSRLQEWDYFLSIMSVKRMQGLYQGTLVAQGAFSIYKTDIVKELGGWSDAIGEDIVLTWNMLKRNIKVFYEPLAIAFTDVPVKFSHFVKQRSRWARGMIEGLRLVRPWKQPNVYYRFLTGIDLLIFLMDFSYVFFFIPGCIMALFGKYYIVGPMLILVFPLTLITFLVLFMYEKKFFDMLHLRVRRNIIGFILFILIYQMIISPISLYGYAQEIFRVKRTWK